MADIKEFVKICRKIICIGRNYVDHALELNNPIPRRPLLFLKPPSSLITEGTKIEIPGECSSLHHEVELGLIIGKEGKNIEENMADHHIAGYVLALDMTARDIQADIKKKGHPWLLAKCWDTFCPVSDFIPKEEVVDPANLSLWLKVDGQLKQSGNTKDMLFPIPKIISYASGIMKLEYGDVILTGTPKGVGPVLSGQVIECGIAGLREMAFQVQ